MPMPALDRWLLQAMGLPSPGPLPTPEALREWQFQSLRETLGHAQAHAPFYARRLAGLRPESVASPRDLGRIPRTTADDLRLAADKFLCVSQDEVTRPVTLHSSGSSGAPKRLFFSQEDLERTMEFFRFGMENLASPGETVLIMLPGHRPGGVGQLLSQALARSGVDSAIMAENATAEMVLEQALVADAGALVGAPHHVNALAAAWARRGCPRDRIHSVLLCWDVIPQAVRVNLRRALGCRVLGHWGMTETGLGGAVDCAEHSGMHLREADLYVEITDPATGRPLPDGEYGEIVVSTLTRRAMPLIRYRSGDLGRLLPGPCSCGSPLRRLDQVPGRIGEGVVLHTGEVLRLPDLDEALLGIPGVADFSAELIPVRPPELRLTITAPDGEGVRRAALAQALTVGPVQRAVEAQALNLRVTLAPFGDNALTFGKRRLTLSRSEALHP